MPKIGRNDPCPCGSGKKYKRCCMDRDRRGAGEACRCADEAEGSHRGSRGPDEQAVELHVALQQRGRPAASAMGIKRMPIWRKPSRAFLCICNSMSCSEARRAWPLRTAASDICIKRLAIWRQARRCTKEAPGLYEALGSKDGMAAAYGNLGGVHQMRGDLPQAAAMYKKSVALFQRVGATAQVQQLQELLDKLTVARS